MKIILLSLLSFGAFAASDITYERAQVWTGNNGFSSAPTPYCPCDRDMNRKDCQESFRSDLDLGDVCYDEYIPEGSAGWAHAVVYRRAL